MISACLNMLACSYVEIKLLMTFYNHTVIYFLYLKKNKISYRYKDMWIIHIERVPMM